jgi:acetyl-CoA acetyltransferase
MRDVAVVGFAQQQLPDFDGSPTCVEMLVPILAECYEQTGWTRRDVGFWCSGSSDYLAGRSFSFVQAVDAIGVTPPVNESHVEMDLAWAMCEAWIKIQTGEVDTALVYAFGKSSAGVLRRTLALQLDPYTMTPLWPDTVSLAGLQARAGIDAGVWDERAMAEVAQRSLTDAEQNEHSIRKGGSSVEELLARPMYADPLRKHDCAPVTDGVAALVLAAGDRAREVRDRPAWITGLSHFVDPSSISNRDLTRSPSAAAAAAAVDLTGVEVAELHAPFSHQELILRRELGLADDVRINPSGGALTSNPMFSGGGIRVGETARRIWSGEISKGVGHATSGAALQQNLLCVLDSSTGKDGL